MAVSEISALNEISSAVLNQSQNSSNIQMKESILTEGSPILINQSPNSSEIQTNVKDEKINQITTITGGTAHILGIGTANPERIVQQKDFPPQYLSALDKPSPRIQDLVQKINKSCGITQRCMEYGSTDYVKNPDLVTVGGPSLDYRSKMFEDTGVDLARLAAERAISDWGGDMSEITHIITFTSSTILCPGLDLRLIKSLGLSQSTKHHFVTFMGCHAGLIGLQRASEIAEGDPKNRVLVVCVEMNSASAHVPHPKNPVNNIIVALIFGDGAAGVIVGANPTKKEVPIFELHRSCTSYIPNTEKSLTVDLTVEGVCAGLDKSVPSLVAGAINGFMRDFIGSEIDFEKDLLWAVHPGGKAILDATEKGCNLSPKKLQASREVMDQYGNMASATIFFVLDKIRKEKGHTQENPWTVALAYGPGITMEAVLMRLALRK